MAATVALAVLAAACSPPPQGVDDVASGPRPGSARPCAALAVGSCALPYPSDEFTVADPDTATGRRVEVPDGLIPDEIAGALGPGGGIGDAFDGADGFSALSPIIFELDAPARPESLPADGGEVLVVRDAHSGARQEIRAELWGDALFRGAPATIVMAWPVTRWEYGHSYIARLGRLEGLLGTPPTQPSGLVDPTAPTEALLAELARHDAVPREELLSLTRFTVGSREAAVGDLEEMARVARSEDHPVRRLESLPPAWFDHGGAIVTGEVRITDFRDEDGVVHPDRPPRQDWIPFVIAVPAEPASPAGAPVAVYGHGLVINKESMLIVASRNAARGVATIGIDVPNHGGRQAGEGGFLLDLARPGSLGRLVGVPAQGIVDHVSLVRAVLDHLDSLDLSPWRLAAAPGDGLADLDTSLLLYEGTSMGGVLGAAEYALIPELDAAFLQVPGAGILDILSHSLLWPLFSGVIPADADAGDAAALLGAASMLLDRGDSTHLLEGLANSGRPLVAQIGVGDAIVPEFSSDRLVRLLGLPRIGEALTGIDAPSQVDQLPADGRGFAEVWPLNSSPLTQGFMAHLVFSEPAAQPLFDEWLDQRLVGVRSGRTG